MTNKEEMYDNIYKLLNEAREKVSKEYSSNKLVNADFVRTQKAMFFEKVEELFFKEEN